MILTPTFPYLSILTINLILLIYMENSALYIFSTLETITNRWPYLTCANVIFVPSLFLQTKSSLQFFMVFLIKRSKCFWFMLDEAWTWVSTWWVINITEVFVCDTQSVYSMNIQWNLHPHSLLTWKLVVALNALCHITYKYKYMYKLSKTVFIGNVWQR